MMEPHMIENYILIVFVIVVNHVGFILMVSGYNNDPQEGLTFYHAT